MQDAHRVGQADRGDGAVGPHPFFADAHVHFHSRFTTEEFLDNTAGNVARAAARLHARAGARGVLLMTESAGSDWFGSLPARQVQGWRFATTAERESLIATGPGGCPPLIIVAGRQVVTSERLEVLWLGTVERPADGRPIREVIAAARESGAVPVLPWGFGKWTGRRRSVMRALLADAALAGAFHFGDNAGRPAFWPKPRWFRDAGPQNRRVLPGSDPLPFPDQVSRPGSFGFYGYANFGVETPWRRLKRLIEDPATELRPYGRLEAPARFLRNQAAMQWRRAEQTRRAVA